MSVITRNRVNLHHVGVPPVRVFLRQWRQDSRACRDTSTHIITHPGTPRHILFLLLIITTWITVITSQWQRVAALFLRWWAPGSRTLGVSLNDTTDQSDPFSFLRDIYCRARRCHVSDADLFWFGATWMSSSTFSWFHICCHSSPYWSSTNLLGMAMQKHTTYIIFNFHIIPKMNTKRGI